jgi:hypothetical protein
MVNLIIFSHFRPIFVSGLHSTGILLTYSIHSGGSRGGGGDVRSPPKKKEKKKKKEELFLPVELPFYF